MRRKERFARLRIASDEGRSALTIEVAKLYLAEFPKDPWALIYYGMALQDLARYPQARAAYERASGSPGSDRS